MTEVETRLLPCGISLLRRRRGKKARERNVVYESHNTSKSIKRSNIEEASKCFVTITY